MNPIKKSFQAKPVKKRKSKGPPSTAITDPKVSLVDDPSDPQDIFTLSDRNHHLVLQSATLIHGLLQKLFASTSIAIQQLQYVIISKILYKIGPNKSKILCVPEIFCRQIVYDSYAKSGFHFKQHQLGPILKPLIYHPNLQDMIVDTIQKCLICFMTPPKRVRK